MPIELVDANIALMAGKNKIKKKMESSFVEKVISFLS